MANRLLFFLFFVLSSCSSFASVFSFPFTLPDSLPKPPEFPHQFYSYRTNDNFFIHSGASLRTPLSLLPLFNDTLATPLLAPYKIPDFLFFNPDLPTSFRNPVTIIQAEVNTQKEQFFNLKHNRTIARFCNAWFAIRSSRSPGIFPQSAENAFLFSSGLNYRSNKNILSFKFHHHKAALQQNGGIADSIISSEGFSLLENNRALTDPILLNAKTRNFETGSDLSFTRFFKPADTLVNPQDSSLYTLQHLGWFFHSNSQFNLDYFYFEEERSNNSPIPYPVFRNTFYDSIQTRDEFRHANFSNTLGIGFDSPKHKFKLSLTGDFNNLYQTFRSTNANSIFLHNRFRTELRKNLSLLVALSNGLTGYNHGDILASGSLRFVMDSLSNKTLSFLTRFSNSSAPLLMNQFFSNSFAWTFDFDKVQSFSTEARFQNNKLSVYAGIRSLNNFLYFDRTASPAASERFSYYYAGLNVATENSFFFAQGNLLYQKENSSLQVLAIPEMVAKSVFGVKARWFKSALNLRAGIDLISSSEFYGKLYIPETGAWVLQNTRTTGKYILADLFIDFRVQTLSGFIKLEHVNDGLTPNAFPAFASMQAINGRLLRIGLIWLMAN